MIWFDSSYDVIVIGAGHAGYEAAHASARMKAKTLLLTISLETIAQLSCNPAIGGLGKSHLVKEIDAFGGLMPELIDQTGIQFRTLNLSKGPAVQALRAQADKDTYPKLCSTILQNTPNLDIVQAMVTEILTDDNSVIGVAADNKICYRSKAVIVTTGTFLNGVIHIGELTKNGGRNGEPAAYGLSESIAKLGHKIGRLKTGTPARLHAESIDYSKMMVQPGDENPPAFSFKYQTPPCLHNQKQIDCYVTHTTALTKQIILDNLERSPLFSGQIKGIGPRYCPSIEDKVKRFSEKEIHHVFIEPEGRNSQEIYPNGISTSLPFDVQLKMIHSIPGLENAEIIRPGYAIEYDYFNPMDLYATLHSKIVPGLFMAGQINGTSGYEEAGAQGLYAAINAIAWIRELDPLILNRNEAYIAVMIDDLVTLGAEEPYRMFTSRAEHRIQLRQDNADLRLCDYAYQYGLISDERYSAFMKKREMIQKELTWLNETKQTGDSLLKIIGRPDFDMQNYLELRQKYAAESIDEAVTKQAFIQAKYSGYLQKEEQTVNKLQKYELHRIPENFDYNKVIGIRNEAKSKFMEVKPMTIGQARRISGITPADIALLIGTLKK